MTTVVSLEHAGGSFLLHRSATLKEREALAAYVGLLKKTGHAISSDEVIENNAASGDIRVWHYLTCAACKNEVS